MFMANLEMLNLVNNKKSRNVHQLFYNYYHTLYSMAFSRKKSLEDAILLKVERAKTMARNPVFSDGTKSDCAIAHPSEVREAGSKNYTNLVKRVTEEVKKYQATAQARRTKTHGG